ncbi:hypothetical protein GUITHDRAFT_108723 [Guillardia theta CCMP2712]|uniref:EF-hand domain-containing protein n=1 Tax=Guillardia theta (strain CCMP2712) TaxID=905079 RepID=L1JBG1_GUITC|nr:hypothetical protein GUITHDRAFT_108723 [Guillardia theta CCMP2712]EKX45459.1 hypothetical protein GUITHDRAFT_108723 [Guillardia theta CCMP2712]|eukprot:XP_005832439.1 hypothetical protein GUITHDRAFT_108723 [Guillardia theta CCMP2712]
MVDDEPDEKIFVIKTVPEGQNSGKPTVLLAGTPQEKEIWVSAVQHAAKVYVKQKARKEETVFTRFQRKSKKLYESSLSQIFFSSVIMASFVTAIMSAQQQTKSSSASAGVLGTLEICFLLVFCLELIWNLLSNWFWNFVSDGWNLLDFFVVAVSVMSEIVQGIPGLNALRLIRIFKMIRVFRMLYSFRVLINALSSSVVPVLNAFAILLIVTSIFAIIATKLFAVKEEDFFGDFFKSMFTLFQMATGDSWASAVVRSLFDGKPTENFLIGLFFVVYMLIVNVVMMNIVVAVLLDEFISTVERERQEKTSQEEQKTADVSRTFRDKGPLDPLVLSLMDFGTLEELSSKISQLYQTIDLDDSGSVDLAELNVGLKKLSLDPPVSLTEEEFFYLTDSRKLLNSDGELGLAGFEQIILKQMSNYVHRKVSVALKSETHEFNQNVMLLLKSLLFSVDKINNPLFNASKSARKSKQEIVRKLFYSTLIRSFSHWKAAVPSLDDLEENKNQGCDLRLSAGIERIEAKVSAMAVRMAKVSTRLGSLERNRSESNLNEEILKTMQEQIASMAHMMELMCQQQFGSTPLDLNGQQDSSSRSQKPLPAAGGSRMVEEVNQRLTTGYILVDKYEPRGASRATLRDPNKATSAADIQLRDRRATDSTPGRRSTANHRERTEDL